MHGLALERSIQLLAGSTRLGCVCCVWGSSPPPQAAHLSFSTTQAGLPPVGRGTCFQWSNRAQSSTHSAERGFPSSCQATHAQQQQPHHSPLRGWLCESWRPPQLFFQVPFWAGSTTSPTAERQTEACERDTGLLLCLDCILQATRSALTTSGGHHRPALLASAPSLTLWECGCCHTGHTSWCPPQQRWRNRPAALHSCINPGSNLQLL